MGHGCTLVMAMAVHGPWLYITILPLHITVCVNLQHETLQNTVLLRLKLPIYIP